MVIAMDIDGVLAKFTAAFNRVLTEVGPTAIREDYEPIKWAWEGSGATAEQVGRAWEAIRKDPTFWRKLSLYDGFWHVMAELELSGHDVYLVTSRMATGGVSALIQTRDWVEILGLSRYLQIIVVNGPRQKALVVRAIGAEVSLDDYPANVRRLQKIPGHLALMLDRPWNSKAVGINDRVASLNEFISRVKTMPERPERSR